MTFQTFSQTRQPSESDDSLYIAWLRNNHGGYVLAFTLPDGFYVTLHKASCTHISRQRPSGSYTRGNYGKHCSDSRQDVQQFMVDPRARVEVCKTCSPPFHPGMTSKRRSNNSDQDSIKVKTSSSVIFNSASFRSARTEQKEYSGSQPTSEGLAAKSFGTTIKTEDLELVAKYCRRRLRLEQASRIQGDPYQCVPVCVIDAVFSIGVRYETTEGVVRRFCSYFNIPYSGPHPRPNIEDQYSVSDFLQNYEQYGIERMTSEVYQNRQRTSTRGGILKSEAVLLFSQVLFNHGVNYLQDMDLIISDPSFEADIMQIPGQRSGISLRAFYMLTGEENFVKPDRMIQRFLYSVLGRHLSFNECHDAIVGAHNLLVQDYPDLTPKSLDHLIWRYERSS